MLNGSSTQVNNLTKHFQITSCSNLKTLA